jgi:GH25 family lysozyme M1 (1,4-beta-N-acetylmuramidase)
MSLVHPAYEIGGCDISYYQNPIRWEILSSRISFVIIRSGDGIRTDGTDPKFTENWHDAKANNVVRGSYFFFRPEIDPVWQANVMIGLLNSDWGEVGIYLDLEINTPRLSKAAYTQAVMKFINAAEPQITSQYNRLIGLYTSYGFWDYNVDHTMIPQLAERPLWVAQWPTTPAIEPSRLPKGWPRWDLWQFSTNGGLPYGQPGNGNTVWGVYSKGLDMNVWRGSKEEFEAFFHCTVGEPPDGGGGGNIVAFRPSTRQNIRPHPSEQATPILGQTALEALPVIGQEKDSQNRTWYKIGSSGEGKYEMWIAGYLGGTVIYE